jgi:cell division protein FtsN
LLQVGSFKSNRDADSLRARLLLLNLNAKIEKVSPRKNETWHRVIVGPFSDRSELADARGKLASNGIDSLLLKRKK